jgi:hypothetical protein
MGCSGEGVVSLIIAAEYTFKNGRAFIQKRYPELLKEIMECIIGVTASNHKSKVSEEKTMPGRMLYDPRSMNKAFEKGFAERGWKPVRIPCEYSDKFYVKGYKPQTTNKRAFREMDFVKKNLGLEVQFGKYAFMVYNVCAKMTIFKKLNIIDSGVEIVPVKAFADQMSTGVSYFEQIVWDLERRGVADIDVPALILGIDL